MQQSWHLSSSNIKLYVVGIGHFVDHGELHSMAHDYRHVSSATDSDALNRLLIETAPPDCNGMYFNQNCLSNLLAINLYFYIICNDMFICVL